MNIFASRSVILVCLAAVFICPAAIGETLNFSSGTVSTGFAYYQGGYAFRVGNRPIYVYSISSLRKYGAIQVSVYDASGNRLLDVGNDSFDGFTSTQDGYYTGYYYLPSPLKLKENSTYYITSHAQSGMGFSALMYTSLGQISPYVSLVGAIGPWSDSVGWSAGWNTVNGNPYLSLLDQVTAGAAFVGPNIYFYLDPIITRQPSDIQLSATNQYVANFSIVVTNGIAPYSYQWMKDGVALTNQTNASLVFSNAGANTVGYYSCQVTDANSNSVISTNAALNISGVPFWLWQGLQAYFPFNGNFNDLMGHLSSASNYGAFSVNNRFGMSNSAIGFNGSQYAVISGLGSVLSGSQSGVTVSGWYYENQGAVGFNSGFIQNPQNQPGPSIRINVGGDPQVVNGNLGGWGGYAGAYDSATRTLFPSGSWHQITAVMAVGQLPQLYLDSVPCPWGTPAPTNPTQPLSFDCNYCVGTSWELGHPFLLPGYLWNGAVSDLRFYNRALSSNEVASLYALETTDPRSTQTIAFPSIPILTMTNGAQALGATASSGLPVLYSIGDASVARITNGSVVPQGVGITTVVASQGGNNGYQPASSVTNPLVVTLAQQNFTPAPITGSTYGSKPVVVLPTNSSGIAVTPRIVSGPATLSGTNLTFTGTGTVTIAYDALGNSVYGAASITNRFVVNPAPQSLSPQVTNAVTYGDGPIVLTQTNVLGLPLTYSVTGSASLSNNLLSITGGGTVTLVTSQAGNSNYLPASITNSFVVYRAPQTLTAQATNPVTYGDGPIVLTQTNSLGLPLSYWVTGPASLSSNLLSITGGGTVTLVTSQAGNSNYLPASITNSFVVNPEPQSFAPAAIAPTTYGSLPLGLTLPTNASGIAVTYRIVSGPATISGTNLILTGTGTVTVAYDAPGNSLYAPATVTNTFTVTNGPTNLKAQTITFKPLAAKTYGIAPYALTATASSKLPLTYWSSNTNVAVVNGTNVVITGAGQTLITAYQPGDGSTYNPASPVSSPLIVNQAAQKITFKTVGTKLYGSGASSLSALSTSGLPVTVTSSDPTIASVSGAGTNLILTDNGTGTVTLTASQSGNANFIAAPSLSQSVIIATGSQTIRFGSLGGATYGAAPIALSATSSAGLPVSFSSSATNIASISGNTLTINSAGSVKITATQSGNSFWAAAKPITQTLVIAKAPQSISFSIPPSIPFTNGGLIPLTGMASSGFPVSYKSGNPKVLTIAGTNCLITGRGTTTVVATQAGGANYLPAPVVTNTVNVQ